MANPSGFFEEGIAAVRAADLDFPFPARNANRCAAGRTFEKPVLLRLAQHREFLHEPRFYGSPELQKPGVFCAAFVNIAGKHTEYCEEQGQIGNQQKNIQSRDL